MCWKRRKISVYRPTTRLDTSKAIARPCLDVIVFASSRGRLAAVVVSATSSSSVHSTLYSKSSTYSCCCCFCCRRKSKDRQFPTCKIQKLTAVSRPFFFISALCLPAAYVIHECVSQQRHQHTSCSSTPTHPSQSSVRPDFLPIICIHEGRSVVTGCCDTTPETNKICAHT